MNNTIRIPFNNLIRMLELDIVGLFVLILPLSLFKEAISFICLIIIFVGFIFYDIYKKIVQWKTTFIRFDVDRIWGLVNTDFNIPKKEILAASIDESSGIRYLTIYDIEGKYEIQCMNFDQSILRQKLKSYLGESIFSDFSYKNLPVFEEYFSEINEFFDQLDQPLKSFVGSQYILPTVIFLASAFVFAFIAFVQPSIYVRSIWFLAITLFSIIASLIFCLETYRYIIVTKDSIRLDSIFHKHEILWKDLEKYTIYHNRMQIELSSTNTKIAFPYYRFWRGQYDWYMLQMINYQRIKNEILAKIDNAL
jgi:hypothetical protein